MIAICWSAPGLSQCLLAVARMVTVSFAYFLWKVIVSKPYVIVYEDHFLLGINILNTIFNADKFGDISRVPQKPFLQAAFGPRASLSAPYIQAVE